MTSKHKTDALAANLEALKVADHSLWSSLEKIQTNVKKRPTTGKNDLFRPGPYHLWVLAGCSWNQRRNIEQKTRHSIDLTLPADQLSRETLNWLKKGCVCCQRYCGSSILQISLENEITARVTLYPVMILYERQVEDFIPLLSALNLSFQILHGRLFFFTGQDNLSAMHDLLLYCHQNVNYISAAEGYLPLDELIGISEEDRVEISRADEDSKGMKTDWTTGTYVQAPRVIIEGQGGKWLFLIRLPSAIDIYPYFLDIKHVLERKKVQVESIIVFPGMPETRIAELIRKIQPDCVCDLYKTGNYYCVTSPVSIDHNLVTATEMITSDIPFL